MRLLVGWTVKYAKSTARPLMLGPFIILLWLYSVSESLQAEKNRQWIPHASLWIMKSMIYIQGYTELPRICDNLCLWPLQVRLRRTRSNVSYYLCQLVPERLFAYNSKSLLALEDTTRETNRYHPVPCHSVYLENKVWKININFTFAHIFWKSTVHHFVYFRWLSIIDLKRRPRSDKIRTLHLAVIVFNQC